MSTIQDYQLYDIIHTYGCGWIPEILKDVDTDTIEKVEQQLERDILTYLKATLSELLEKKELMRVEDENGKGYHLRQAIPLTEVEKALKDLS